MLIRHWRSFMERRNLWITKPPKWVKRLEAALCVAGAIVVLYPLLYLPVEFILTAMRHAIITGTGVEQVAILPVGWKVATFVMIFTMIAGSSVIGGLMRMAVEQVRNKCGILILVGLGGGLFAYLSSMVRGAIATLDVELGDHALVAGFLIAWLFVVGYVCKVPWDRARDLWRDHFDRARRRGDIRSRNKARRLRKQD